LPPLHQCFQPPTSLRLQAEDPFSAAAADEDCVVLPPGCFPARIPFIQTLTDGDKCGPEPWKSSEEFFYF